MIDVSNTFLRVVNRHTICRKLGEISVTGNDDGIYASLIGFFTQRTNNVIGLVIVKFVMFDLIRI